MAGLCVLVSRHLITCTAHLSIELWKMRYITFNALKLFTFMYIIWVPAGYKLIKFKAEQ